MRYITFTWLTLATLFAAGYSKSVGSRSQSTPESSDERLPTILTDLTDINESNLKNNLLVLMPIPERSDEDAENSQKTKRCKTLNHRSNVANQVFSKSKIYKNEKDVEDDFSTDGGVWHRLVTLKNPKTILRNGLRLESLEGENEAERRENIAALKEIQENLRSKDHLLGSSKWKSASELKMNGEKNKYICYCKEQNKGHSPHHVEEHYQKSISKQPWISRKNKIDDRKIIITKNESRKKPIYPDAPHDRFVSQRLPVLYSQDASHYAPKSVHRKTEKISKDAQNIAYVPFLYRLEPELRPAIRDRDPIKINIPFTSVRDRSDYFVGRNAPQGDNFDQHRQTIQNFCQKVQNPNEKLPTSMNSQDDLVGSTRNAYSFEAGHKNPNDKSTVSTPNINENSTESRRKTNGKNSLGLTRPEITTENSRANVENESLNSFEIEEVTSVYYTSKAHADETDQTKIHGEFYATSTEPMSATYSENQIDDVENSTMEISTTTDVDPRFKDESSTADFSQQSAENFEVSFAKNKTHVNQLLSTKDDSSMELSTTEISKEILEESSSKSVEFSGENYSTELPGTNDTNLTKNEMRTEEPIEFEEIEKVKDVNNLPEEQTIEENSSNSKDEIVAMAKQLGNIEKLVDSSREDLPFSDIALIKESIKAVINKFVSNETDEKMIGGIVDSTSQYFSPEIIEIPNLRTALSQNEETILDEVKDRLAKITGALREKFDSDWSTDVIRNNLRQMLSGIPAAKNKNLPAMTVEEHEFKNGAWGTHLVTLAPPENRTPLYFEKIRAEEAVENIPYSKFQAAKSRKAESPMVYFAPENPTADEQVDFIRTSLNEEMADDAITTTENALTTESWTSKDSEIKKINQLSESVTDRDMDKLEEEESSTDSWISTTTSGYETTTEMNEKTDTLGNPEEMEFANDSQETSTEEASTIFEDQLVDRKRNFTSGESIEPTTDFLSSFDSTTERDLSYIGKISASKPSDNLQSLMNSNLFYVGDNVKLPLEIRKLSDGSYGLSISRKFCEHILNKKCPCCVPANGNVVRTVRKEEDPGNSVEKIGTNERRKRNLIDEDLETFSMPVKIFAKRYNLSLNLEKGQTPQGYEGKESLGLRRTDRSKDPILDRMHLADDVDQRQYRYQRNINEETSRRVEIMKNLIHWLKEVFLNSDKKDYSRQR